MVTESLLLMDKENSKGKADIWSSHYFLGWGRAPKEAILPQGGGPDLVGEDWLEPTEWWDDLGVAHWG